MRRLPALLLAVLALLVTGCATSDEEPGEALPTARFAIPSDGATPSPASPPASGAPASDQPVTGEDTPAARRAFARGLAAYCSSYYTLLSRAEEAHPVVDPVADVLFARAAARAAAVAERRLAPLLPPPDLAEDFADFVTVTHEITDDRERIAGALAASGREGIAGSAFDEASEARRPLATALHASICDGRLPAAQEAAVVQVVREVESSPDSDTVCADLVTPGFLQYTWAVFADPVAACAATRDARRDGLATDIDVADVTGADGIVATVHYALVGGCHCGEDSVARLHLVDGAWRVSSISY